uniref:Uncharacterized protein n=1 Tax=Leptobrachium leishanense TaxID=445787 RepID=A0A8C5Q2D3_9ANUR
METPFTPLEIYIKEFNPVDYFDTYYAAGKGSLDGAWTSFALKNLHALFSSGKIKGDTIIDIGTGPTIYQLLSACEVFKNIIASDLLEQNREQLKKWLRKDPDMLDWSVIVKMVCDLEGNSEKPAEKEEKLRKAIKKVLMCDVLKKNPFEPLVLPPADCLLSCLCLEAPCKDVEAYCEVVKNFNHLLKPGGDIVIIKDSEMLQCSSPSKPTSALSNSTQFGDIETILKDLSKEINLIFAMYARKLSECSFADASYVQEFDDILKEARSLENHLKQKRESFRSELTRIANTLQK